MTDKLILYYASGSPFAWRVWLALEHKKLDYEFKLLSFDAGDLDKPEFVALNPRRRVPVLQDGAVVLRESTAIVEYLEDRYPDQPRLFSSDLRERARQRMLIREADNYIQALLEEIFESMSAGKPDHIADCVARLNTELANWEGNLAGDYLSSALSAADFTLFPQLALIERFSKRLPSGAAVAFGPRLQTWMARMRELETVKKTWPPHWK